MISIDGEEHPIQLDKPMVAHFRREETHDRGSFGAVKLDHTILRF